MNPEIIAQLGIAAVGAVGAFVGCYAAMRTTLAVLQHRVNELERWKDELRHWKHNDYTHDIEVLRKELYQRTSGP